MDNKLTRCVQNRKKSGLSLKNCFEIPCTLCPITDCEAERGEHSSMTEETR